MKIERAKLGGEGRVGDSRQANRADAVFRQIQGGEAPEVGCLRQTLDVARRDPARLEIEALDSGEQWDSSQ